MRLVNLLSPLPPRLNVERQTRLANDSLAQDHISITEVIRHNGNPRQTRLDNENLRLSLLEH